RLRTSSTRNNLPARSRRPRPSRSSPNRERPAATGLSDNLMHFIFNDRLDDAPAVFLPAHERLGEMQGLLQADVAGHRRLVWVYNFRHSDFFITPSHLTVWKLPAERSYRALFGESVRDQTDQAIPHVAIRAQAGPRLL